MSSSLCDIFVVNFAKIADFRKRDLWQLRRLNILTRCEIWLGTALRRHIWLQGAYFQDALHAICDVIVQSSEREWCRRNHCT